MASLVTREMYSEKIVIPKGVKPGNTITVNLPTGKSVVITVPKGMRPGNVLTINYTKPAANVEEEKGEVEAAAIIPERRTNNDGFLEHGQIIALTNEYGEGSLLNSCCGATVMNDGWDAYAYGVNTCPTDHSDVTNPCSQWMVLREAGEGTVNYGDRIQLKNMYGAGSMLNTCYDAASVLPGWEGYGYGVNTCPTDHSDVSNDCSWWSFTGGEGAVKLGDSVQLQNHYGGGSLLNTCDHASVCDSWAEGGYTYAVNTCPQDHADASNTCSKWKVTGDILSHGSPVRFVNWYGRGSTLVSCCGATVVNEGWTEYAYGVCTCPTDHADSTNDCSEWTILRKDGNGTLCYGDLVQLRNEYGPGSYLNTCCSATVAYEGWEAYSYAVNTCPLDHGDATIECSWWKLTGGDEGKPVRRGDCVQIRNNYGDGSFLNTCEEAAVVTEVWAPYTYAVNTCPEDHGDMAITCSKWTIS